MPGPVTDDDSVAKAHYSPPWADTSIIGIAGSSGSGKTSLSFAIIRELDLPWVVILSMDSFYKPLTPEQSELAFRNEWDLDAPEALDFDLLLEVLQNIKAGYDACHPVGFRHMTLTVRKQKGRSTDLLFREARSPRPNHDDLLASRADPRGHICTSRRACTQDPRYADLRRS